LPIFQHPKPTCGILFPEDKTRFVPIYVTGFVSLAIAAKTLLLPLKDYLE